MNFVLVYAPAAITGSAAPIATAPPRPLEGRAEVEIGEDGRREFTFVATPDRLRQTLRDEGLTVEVRHVGENRVLPVGVGVLPLDELLFGRGKAKASVAVVGRMRQWAGCVKACGECSARLC